MREKGGAEREEGEGKGWRGEGEQKGRSREGGEKVVYNSLHMV